LTASGSSSVGLFGGGAVHLEATTGNITASGPTRIETIYSSTTGITIQAPGTGSGEGNVDLGSATTVRSYYSPITILARNSILGDADLTTRGTVTGSVSLEAQTGTLSVGTVNTTSSSSGSYSISRAGSITLAASGNVTAGTLYAGQAPSYSTGVGGTISISSGSGDITLTDAFSPGGLVDLSAPLGSVTATDLRVDGDRYDLHGGDIAILARGDVQLSRVTADGYGGVTNQASIGAGDGGAISITSTNGNISLLLASANGGYATSIGGGSGGSILLSAEGGAANKGNVTVRRSLRADGGGYEPYSDPGYGGEGGIVTVVASRDIRINTDESALGGISVTGGTVSYGSGSGGMGGEVSLFSSQGDISLLHENASIDLSGGSGSNSDSTVAGGGGAGGILSIEAVTGSVTIPLVRAVGGDGVMGVGGDGGLVGIIAQGDVTMEPEYGFSIVADGGSAFGARGGNGGIVSVQSTGGSIFASSAGEPPPETSNLALPLASRPAPRYSGFSAVGGTGSGNATGTGALGGDGGVIALDAADDIKVQAIDVRGGDAVSSPGRAGGIGGVASLSFGGVLEAEEIRASGGWGSAGEGTVPGGDGGGGGTIHIERKSGNLEVTSDYLLDARGGQGGDGAA
ncbi:MAG TPA: hypothetical protein VIL30_00380, partial [Ramlibacter sp.]